MTDVDNACPKCGAPGIQVCAGCHKPTEGRDCGCPCGTSYICSRHCSRKPDGTTKKEPTP